MIMTETELKRTIQRLVETMAVASRLHFIVLREKH